MSKILAQSGTSLADVYDIEGSIVGVEELNAAEVQTVHEMGHTLWAERFGTNIARFATGDLAASVEWNILIDTLPTTPFRIYGVSVFADVSARANTVTVLARDPISDREFPIWNWDLDTDIFVDMRIADQAAVGVLQELVPTRDQQVRTPITLTGVDQPQRVPNVSFRGLTTAFGAGTVEHTLLIYFGFAQIGGISSHGLPLPGW